MNSILNEFDAKKLQMNQTDDTIFTDDNDDDNDDNDGDNNKWWL